MMMKCLRQFFVDPYFTLSALNDICVLWFH